MLISNVTPEEQEQRNVLNREMLAMNAQIYIRNAFRKSITKMEAESWIAIAQEQGMLELALELTNDLATELHITLS